MLWLIEGGTKIYDDWLNPANIRIVRMPSVDGTTVATTEAQETSKNTQRMDSNTAATGDGTEAVKSTESSDSDTAGDKTVSDKRNHGGPKPLIKPLWIYKWFEQKVIVKFAFVFQAFVVIAEILIGLALLGGLFTFIASAGSIGLSLMFIVSGMATKEIFWFIFTAIVMMGGAGKSAGLDYWVMPRIKKWWNARRFAWKTYFYIDNPVLKKKKGK